MGTRSLTTFIEVHKNPTTGRKRKNKIVTMYRQYDGFLEEHGLELAEFLASGTMVSGLGFDEERIVFNGMPCLSAQAVAHFKTAPGGFYLFAPSNDRESYNYEVIGDYDTKEITLIAKDYSGKVLFKGTPQQFLEANLEELEQE